jgi:hypothetical protein
MQMASLLKGCPPFRFFRTFPRIFTGHACVKIQPRLRVAVFSTNPQRSSQQQALEMYFV